MISAVLLITVIIIGLMKDLEFSVFFDVKYPNHYTLN
jgi:hypothetical protein